MELERINIITVLDLPHETLPTTNNSNKKVLIMNESSTLLISRCRHSHAGLSSRALNRSISLALVIGPLMGNVTGLINMLMRKRERGEKRVRGTFFGPCTLYSESLRFCRGQADGR